MSIRSGISFVGLAVGVRTTRFALRAFGFSQTVRVLRRISPMASSRSVSSAEASAWAASIARAGRGRYTASCLDRSVFLWFLMRQHEMDPDVRIGIAFEGDRLEGHAWVELDGAVVSDAPDIADHFAVFDDDPTGIAFS